MSEVTQADRDAAARWSRDDTISAEIAAGHVDGLPLLQILATHREEAARNARREAYSLVFRVLRKKVATLEPDRKKRPFDAFLAGEISALEHAVMDIETEAEAAILALGESHD